MEKKLFALLAAAAFLGASAGSALAFSTDPAPSGPGMSSNFSDPDTAVDNIANPTPSGSTQLSVQTQGTGSARILPPARPTAEDAEPVNPGWPLWMQWHQN